MKCTIPEISWHNRDPVLSVDLQRTTLDSAKDSEFFWRLATGGADSHVLIWHITVGENGTASIVCVADLNRHQKAVNVVRFSPSGELLASGDDESLIIVWKQKEGIEPPPLPGEEQILNKEHWSSLKILRGHLEDVYDISWSPDSTMMVSGSVDNTAIIWNIDKGRSTHILQDYKGFVQGVAWDPLNQYITTLSSDRQCRLIDINSMKTIQRVSKAKIPTAAGSHLEGKIIRLFHDDTLKSFFRRLTFTIDGSLIIAPSGIIEPLDSAEQSLNTTIIFSRHNIKEPIIILPSLDEPTVAVKCCPVYFELRKDGPASMIILPYRLLFAVASQKSILIYDTQQISPIAVITNIHYTRLTDVTWSSDGRLLVVSSTDGYCSIVHFKAGELGEIYQAKSANLTEKDIIHDNKDEKTCLQEEKSDKPEFTFDFAAMDVDKDEEKPENTSKDKDVKISEDTEDIKLVYSENIDSDAKKPAVEIDKSTVKAAVSPKRDQMPVISMKTPRRVQLITLSSPKRKKKE